MTQNKLGKRRKGVTRRDIGLYGAALSTTLLMGTRNARASQVVKFGLMSSFTGPAASFGEVEAVSVEIAIADINAAGGIKLKDGPAKVELIKYDHAYDPSKATTLARQAVQDGVRFLEVLGGGVIPAVQTVSEPAKMLLFGQGAGTHWLGPKRPFTFQPFYNIGANAVVCLEYLKQAKPQTKKIALVYPDDDMGESIAGTVIAGAKRFGFEVERHFVTRSTTDYYPLLSSMMRSPPDYIDIDGMPGPQYATLAKQSRENGYKGGFIFSTSLDPNAFRKLSASDAIVGSLNAPAWAEWSTEIGKRWTAEVDRRLPGNRQMWTGRSYDNLILLKAAIEDAGTLDTTQIAQALERVTVSGLAGTVRYVNRSIAAPIPVGEIYLTSNGDIALKKVFEGNG